jgi:hypothetical protein
VKVPPIVAAKLNAVEEAKQSKNMAQILKSVQELLKLTFEIIQKTLASLQTSENFCDKQGNQTATRGRPAGSGTVNCGLEPVDRAASQTSAKQSGLSKLLMNKIKFILLKIIL